MHRRTTLRVAALALVAASSIAGCSSGSGGSAAAPAALASASPSPSTSPSPSPSPSPSASPTDGPSADPLTGGDTPAIGPVVAIKVDNAASARPLQRGLETAALVYQELVEGGATRFMGIWEGGSATEVGPVRSARPSDVQVLAQYGKAVFGFSGANRGVLAIVNHADLAAEPQETIGDAGYTQKGRRPEAYNFFTTPGRLALAAAAKHPADPTDVGLRFGDLPAGAGTPVAAGRVAFTGYSTVGFRWDAGRGGWVLDQDGRPMTMTSGVTLAPQNVVVQYVDVSAGGFVDVLGNNSPDSVTVGDGDAVVFRDGVRLAAHWSRPSAADGTHLLDPAGADVRLHPGRTWLLLVPKGHPVTGS